MNSKIEELANLAAKHKLVPFLGAGCSINHLNYDWDMIRDELSEDIDPENGDHLDVAQEYVQQHGKDQLCEYLRDRLLIEDFDDDRGFSNLAVMSLGLGVIYTTNQDNVMEKCFEKYGRNYSKIVLLEDLAESTPGDKLLFKFHGDFSNCSSIVFSTEDYEKRINEEDHFLNIRLKSDLLAKSLLFIGYSLRDKNIQLMLKELNTAFRGKLPPSYMIAWEYSDELKEVCDEHGIKLIDPINEIPDAENNSEAFDRLLKELVEETFMLKVKMESELLVSAVPWTNRVVCKFEIDAINKVVDEKDFEESCEKFRAIMDQSLIPKDFEPAVVNIFEKLAIKCSNSTESKNLENAAFNLKLSNPKSRFEVLILLMTTANVRSSHDIFHPIVHGVKEEGYILAIPAAIKHLIDGDRPINDSFRTHVTLWVEQSMDIDNFDANCQEITKQFIDKAWEGPTTLEHPLKRKKRLEKHKSGFKARTYEEILSNMLDRHPKTTKRPFEE